MVWTPQTPFPTLDEPVHVADIQAAQPGKDELAQAVEKERRDDVDREAEHIAVKLVSVPDHTRPDLQTRIEKAKETGDTVALKALNSEVDTERDGEARETYAKTMNAVMGLITGASAMDMFGQSHRSFHAHGLRGGLHIPESAFFVDIAKGIPGHAPSPAELGIVPMDVDLPPRPNRKKDK